MKLFFVIFLGICTLTRSQRRHFRQSNYPSQQINPDAIYFDDNLPQTSQINSRDNVSNAEQKLPSVVENMNESSTNENVQINGAAKALTNFSLKLMKYINLQSRGNTVASPYSVATLLSLIQQGATGVGLEQLSAALQMDQRTSASSFRGHIADLQRRNTRNILKTANNLFLANAFKLSPEYRVIAQRDYRCDITPTSFFSSIQAAEDINGWVASRTDNKITKIVSPDTLSINTQLVLVNAIYFKGIWDIPFRKQSTKTSGFRLSDGTVTQVEYMHTRRNFKFGKDEQTGSMTVILPFESDEYSLMVILPSKLINVRDTLSLLTVEQLEQYNKYNPMEVMLDLPKFTVKSDADLTPVLKNMGIKKIFEQRSDLTKIGSFQTINPQVTSAAHSALLSIDEEGGSAAAASAFAAVALSNSEPSIVFQVNRPFIAIIWDTKAKIPLFLATIENPAA